MTEAGSISLISFRSYFLSYFSLETFSHLPSVPWMVSSRMALHSREDDFYFSRSYERSIS